MKTTLHGLLIIQNGKITRPRYYVRPNRSLVEMFLGDFITPYGLFIPLDYFSIEMISILNQVENVPRSSISLMRGLLFDGSRSFHEITYGVSSTEGVISIFNPLACRENRRYSRASDQSLDVLGSAGLHFNHTSTQILTAAAKISYLNPRHYVENDMDDIFGLLSSYHQKPICDFFKSAPLSPLEK